MSQTKRNATYSSAGLAGAIRSARSLHCNCSLPRFGVRMETDYGKDPTHSSGIQKMRVQGRQSAASRYEVHTRDMSTKINRRRHRKNITERIAK